MKTLAAVLLLGTAVQASPARADIPFLNASCPTGIEVHADQGGPVYINGQEARITTSNRSYTEAHRGSIRISIAVNPDGSLIVTYTRNEANGICRVRPASVPRHHGCPRNVSEANRYQFPGCN